MKDAFFACDSFHYTGPSTVNRYYKKYLGTQYTFAEDYTSFLHRLWGNVAGVLRHKVIVFSGASHMDRIILILGKLLNRKLIYIMHGCIQEENRINQVVNVRDIILEKAYLKYSDIVLCVSEQFTIWLKEYYPEYQEKMYTLTNGVDWEILSAIEGAKEKDPYAISTIGGGVPRKNVISICRAINQLNQNSPNKYTLKVFGRDDLDTDEVRAYPFVQYFGIVQKEILLSEIAKTSLFVQDSIFDTFALAPMEALMCGCSILCSKNVGALSILNELQEYDIITDCLDTDEIMKKIAYLLEHGNQERLVNGLDKEKTGFEYRAGELDRYIQSLISSQCCQSLR